MLPRLVDFVLRMRPLVLMSALILVCGGALAYSRLDVEAYPNPVPPLVETIVQPTGWSAEEVERYITIPMEVGLAGMPGLTHIRSQSLFGLSDIKCYFAWDTRYVDARQEVINRLTLIQLPNGNQAADFLRGMPLVRSSAIPSRGRDPHRQEDGRRLDPGTPVEAGPRRHRRHELRRAHQAVSRRRGPVSLARPRGDPRAATSAPERRPKRRRPATDGGRGIVRHSRDWSQGVEGKTPSRHRRDRHRRAEGHAGDFTCSVEENDSAFNTGGLVADPDLKMDTRPAGGLPRQSSDAAMFRFSIGSVCFISRVNYVYGAAP